MSPEELAAIKARAEAATPGPWASEWYSPTLKDGSDEYWAITAPDVEVVQVGSNGSWQNWDGGVLSDADAAFIAAARSDVPALVAEVELLRNRISTLERGA